jgi:hypothetical protein
MVEDLCLAITRSARDAVSRTAIENRRANYYVAKYQPATAVHLENGQRVYFTAANVQQVALNPPAKH